MWKGQSPPTQTEQREQEEGAAGCQGLLLKPLDTAPPQLSFLPAFSFPPHGHRLHPLRPVPGGAWGAVLRRALSTPG